MSFEQFYNDYFPFWNKLNDDDKKYLCQKSSIVHFEKEEAVHDNMGCSGLYIVVCFLHLVFCRVLVLMYMWKPKYQVCVI